MSSTKTERKLSTWFWWLLTALPLFVIIVYFIMGIVNLNTQSGTPLTAEQLFSYWNNTDFGSIASGQIVYTLTDFIPDDIYQAINTLLDTLGVINTDLFKVILSWGIAIQLYRILFDFACLLPRLARKYLNRGFGVND